jgi:hypothetical protein
MDAFLITLWKEEKDEEIVFLVGFLASFIDRNQLNIFHTQTLSPDG